MCTVYWVWYWLWWAILSPFGLLGMYLCNLCLDIFLWLTVFCVILYSVLCSALYILSMPVALVGNLDTIWIHFPVWIFLHCQPAQQIMLLPHSNCTHFLLDNARMEHMRKELTGATLARGKNCWRTTLRKCSNSICIGTCACVPRITESAEID